MDFRSLAKKNNRCNYSMVHAYTYYMKPDLYQNYDTFCYISNKLLYKGLKWKKVKIEKWYMKENIYSWNENMCIWFKRSFESLGIFIFYSGNNPGQQ